MIMYKNEMPKNSSTKVDFIKWRFKEVGVKIEDLAVIVYDSQIQYNDSITMEDCIESIKKVLSKREIQHTLITAINLDVLCEQDKLLGPLQAIVFEDRGTFGVDETLINSAQLYGSIAISNAFELDKTKPGIIGIVDKMGKHTPYCNTFLDDMLCVIAGSAMGRIAHMFDPGNDTITNKDEPW